MSFSGVFLSISYKCTARTQVSKAGSGLCHSHDVTSDCLLSVSALLAPYTTQIFPTARKLKCFTHCMASCTPSLALQPSLVLVVTVVQVGVTPQYLFWELLSSDVTLKPCEGNTTWGYISPLKNVMMGRCQCCPLLFPGCTISLPPSLLKKFLYPFIHLCVCVC